MSCEADRETNGTRNTMPSSSPNNDYRATGIHPAFKAEQDFIQQLDDALATNLLKPHRESLERLLGKTFILRLPNGDVIRKVELLDLLAGGHLAFKSFRREDKSVRLSDANLAFVTGSCAIEMDYMGVSMSGQFRYTALYVRHSAPWQAVAMFQYDGLRVV